MIDWRSQLLGGAIVLGVLCVTDTVSAQTPTIVVDRVHQVTTSGGPFGIFRPFGVAMISCPSESGREPATIADVLGANVKTISVRGYKSARFTTEAHVIGYVRAMMTARPEGDRMSGLQTWSEGGDIEVVMVTEWKDGRFGRFDLGSSSGAGSKGNQFAHLEDHRGCERWGRFGPVER